jgi:MFS transporter, DHA3 family, macrolide efflux protein
MAERKFSKGMRIFSVIWFGQLVSTLGSGLTGFALGVWIYEETGSTTLFALNLLAYALPNLLISPLAGALVDRWDRRKVMMFSDGGAMLGTLMVIGLLLTGRLEVWHVYIATAIYAGFNTFQWPAYSAVTTLLVPKSQLGRAGGMVQIGEAISQLISPALAGVLYVTTGLRGVILIDIATFLFAVMTLSLVRFPRPEETKEGAMGKGSLFKEAIFGWQYIVARKGLLGLLMVFAATNFLSGLYNPLLAPMLLDMTDPQTLGYLASIVGVGMLVGTLVMSAWGGPKRRVHGVLGFLIIGGVFTMILGMTPSIPIIAMAGFGMLFVHPIVNGSSQALWQSKVAPDVQGRVFSVRRMIAWSTMPLAYITAGPLVDKVFGPLMLEGGGLASSLGPIIGVGPGRGTGLLIVLIGLLTVLVTASAYLNPRIRNVEDDLPDSIQEGQKPEGRTEDIPSESLDEVDVVEDGSEESYSIPSPAD